MPSEFVQKHFDKLLLVCLFSFMLLFTLIAATIAIALKGNVDPSNVAWCRETAGTILGALIGLISGMSLRGRAQAPAAKEADEGAGEGASGPHYPQTGG